MSRYLGIRLVAPAASLLVAAAMSAWVAFGLFHRIDLSAPQAEPRASVIDSVVPARKATTISIDANPFRSDRQAAPARFRMPGEGAELDAGSRAPAAASLILIGTAVLADGGSFAMCQIGGESPRLVRIGERFAGFTLRQVSQGHATFSTPSGKSLEVQVAKAGN